MSVKVKKKIRRHAVAAKGTYPITVITCMLITDRLNTRPDFFKDKQLGSFEVVTVFSQLYVCSILMSREKQKSNLVPTRTRGTI